jgi:hypothetical protein
MVPTKIYLHKTHAEESKFSSVARNVPYISVEALITWMENNRLNKNPLAYDRYSHGQNDAFKDMLAFIVQDHEQ